MLHVMELDGVGKMDKTTIEYFAAVGRNLNDLRQRIEEVERQLSELKEFLVI